jgi:RNA polymerase sporulation-specific sigma factor
VADKSQSELATELGVSQGEISKRRQELNLQIWKELGLLSVKDIEEQLKRIRQGKSKRRNRTDTEW